MRSGNPQFVKRRLVAAFAPAGVVKCSRVLAFEGEPLQSGQAVDFPAAVMLVALERSGLQWFTAVETFRIGAEGILFMLCKVQGSLQVCVEGGGTYR